MTNSIHCIRGQQLIFTLDLCQPTRVYRIDRKLVSNSSRIYMWWSVLSVLLRSQRHLCALMHLAYMSWNNIPTAQYNHILSVTATYSQTVMHIFDAKACGTCLKIIYLNRTGYATRCNS